MATKKKAPAKQKLVNPLVLVRSRDSGVTIGELVARGDDGCVVLYDARRLWRWRGASTLFEVATKGVTTEYTRLSEPVPEITIIGACEIIPVLPEARASLTTSRWPS